MSALSTADLIEQNFLGQRRGARRLESIQRVVAATVG